MRKGFNGLAALAQDVLKQDPLPIGSATRPRAAKDQRTKSAYIFGAICPAQGVGAGLVLPRCNTQAMQWHLEEISSQVSLAAHAILIVDQVIRGDRRNMLRSLEQTDRPTMENNVHRPQEMGA